MMTAYLTSTSDLVSVADSIRHALGLSDALSYPFGFIEALQPTEFFRNVSSLYDNTRYGDIISSTAERVRPYAFNGFQNITGASLNSAEEVGECAFRSCFSLAYGYFPNVKSIGDLAFGDCNILSSIYAPSVSYIGNNAFTRCSLRTASFPEAVYVGNNAFYSNHYLNSITLEKATFIGSAAFLYCSSIATINLPMVTQISGTTNFGYMSALQSLYLTSPTIIELQYSTAFLNSPFWSGGNEYKSTAKIYVPASLLNSYKALSKWAKVSANLVGI